MRFVVAGGGVAGLATALAVARAGHSAVVIERDAVDPHMPPGAAFDVARTGIPHFHQPHAFLPRGRTELQALAPDVLEDLIDAGADPQDLAEKLHGPREPGDEDLVYLWVRRPVIEWALRRAAAAEPAVEFRQGATVAGLLTDEDGRAAAGVALAGAAAVRGDVVVDALGRYRCPPDWPRAAGTPTDSGHIYYSRYFELVDGAEHLDWPLLNPRGDLGYMGFNTFRGDNRTYAIVLLVPAADRELRVLRDEATWMAACSHMRVMDQLTSPDHGRPITGVLPMGGLMNVERTGDPGVRNLVAVGDGLCHTDPGFSYGLAFSLAHARAVVDAAAEAPDDLGAAYRDRVGPEARERHRLVCELDAARLRRWLGDAVDIGRRDGSYPLFSWMTAMITAPHDDHVLRRAIGRAGLLDRLHVFDEDTALHARIEAISADIATSPPPPAGPPRDELLARLVGSASRA